VSIAILAAACGPLQLPEQAAGDVPPAHPASTQPAATASGQPRDAPTPASLPTGRIALLLPLSGAQRAAAEAIRDGFLAAYYDDPARGEHGGIGILDEEQSGAVAGYQSAIAAGATLVVGPLLKPSVTAVAGVAGAVPTLALNFLDAGPEPPGNFYQFALSPEDEAELAATRAAAEGRLHALALVPNNDWGQRMLGAFTPALEARGGTVVAYRFYDPSATDFTAEIQRLLLIDESRARHRQLASELGISLGFEPRRRSDADHIFLAANVAAGRLIRPQLRFLYAGDLPTYSTSAIYQPGTSGDADLDGVMFSDAPALLGAEPQAQELRATVTSRWPAGALGRMRLFAMGYDAYTLANSIAAGNYTALPGLTGMLSIDAGRRIHRDMPWAEFRDGRVVALPALP
jgi:outer membrane PBP1 activator LpoA protein